MALKVINGVVRGPDGAPFVGATITAKLSQAATLNGTDEVVPITIRATSAAGGAYSLSLHANNDMAPTGTYYTINESDPAGAFNNVFAIVVPQGAGPYAMPAIMTGVAPTASPQAGRFSTLTVDGLATFSAGPIQVGVGGLDTITAANLNIGLTQAVGIFIGKAGVLTVFGAGIQIGANQGVDTSVAGNLYVGTTNATTMVVGRAGQVFIFGGNNSTGAVQIQPGSGIDTAGPGAINLGTSSATSIQIGKNGTTTTVAGILTASMGISLGNGYNGGLGIHSDGANIYVEAASSNSVIIRPTSGSGSNQSSFDGAGTLNLAGTLRPGAPIDVQSVAGSWGATTGLNAGATGDKISLYGVTTGSQYGLGIQTGKMVLYTGGSVAVRAFSASGQASSGSDGIVFNPASGLVTVLNTGGLDTIAGGAQLALGVTNAGSVLIGKSGVGVGMGGNPANGSIGGQTLTLNAGGYSGFGGLRLNGGDGANNHIMSASATIGITPNSGGAPILSIASAGALLAPGLTLDTNAAGTLVIGAANATNVTISAGATQIMGFSTGLVNFLTGATGLGGGAAPTFGTIGGSGPAAAAQFGWLKVNIAGTASFVPYWR